MSTSDSSKTTARKQLATILSRVTRPLGFRRRGDNWYRLGDELYSIVNIQRSGWDDLTFFINVGFSPAARVSGGWQPEYKCMVRFRIDSINSIASEDLRLLSDDDLAAESQDEWGAILTERIVAPLMSVLENTDDLDDLRTVLRENVSKQVMLHWEMKELFQKETRQRQEEEQ